MKLNQKADIHVITSMHGRREQPLSNNVYISAAHLNPILKPTTTTTKACAIYESVKIPALEERK
jgi:hypothetical protein